MAAAAAIASSAAISTSSFNLASRLKGPCFTTPSSITMANEPFVSKLCCLTGNAISIVPKQPPSFHASNSFFLGKVSKLWITPKGDISENNDVIIKAAMTFEAPDSFTPTLEKNDVFLNSLELTAESVTSTSKDNEIVQDSGALSSRKVFRQERNPKCLNSSAAQRTMLDNHQILLYPLRTESTIRNIASNNTLVFVVDKHADKKNIRAAAKELFKIKTRKVNTSIMPDGTKKAFLMLTRDQNASEVAKKMKIF